MSADGTSPEIVARHVWKHVVVGGPDECWPWLGARNKRGGHGVAYIGHQRSMAAHRAVYQLVIGPIPRELVTDHLCRNPWCVNPAHIEPVTQLENVRRGRAGDASRARCAAVTHCPQGHEYTIENTKLALLGNGYLARQCRECGRVRCREYQRAHRKGRRS